MLGLHLMCECIGLPLSLFYCPSHFSFNACIIRYCSHSIHLFYISVYFLSPLPVSLSAILKENVTLNIPKKNKTNTVIVPHITSICVHICGMWRDYIPGIAIVRPHDSKRFCHWPLIHLLLIKYCKS